MIWFGLISDSLLYCFFKKFYEIKPVFIFIYMCTCNSNVLSASLHDYLWWMRICVCFVIHFLVNVPTNARVNTHKTSRVFIDDMLKSSQG
jgi:hypothetical protein